MISRFFEESTDEKNLFIMTNEKENVMIEFVFNAMKVRQTAMLKRNNTNPTHWSTRVSQNDYIIFIVVLYFSECVGMCVFECVYICCCACVWVYVCMCMCM